MAYITRCVRAQMEGNDDQPPPPQPQPPQPQPQPPILPLVRPPLPPARKFSEDDEQAECSICLEEFEAGVDVRRLGSCGHLFHLICIDQWLEGQATCPLCRGSVV
ncbi:unnamed protein product [Linum tenue]|uniref:RING-type domain-containing protein n=1 Tax=Linum tenue TaxID=586396 RepID=A0AAV0IFD1_9ROSI|nr:unnamed protein product [Linum tenue]